MNLLNYSFIVLIFTACSHYSNTPKSVDIPDAEKIPYEHVLHGDKRLDNYYWMKERDSKKVLDYISEENKYANFNLKPAKETADTLFKEMKGRVKEDDTSAPYKKGDYYYYSRVEKNKEYSIYCRKKGSLTAPEEVILDVNVLAKGKKYYSAGVVGVSPNQEILAYAVDEVGRRFYTLFFKNLKTGETLKDTITKTTGNWVWANDNKTGFYTKQNPDTLRSDTVFRYTLGDKEHKKIYFEKDELFSTYVVKSLNDRTIFIVIDSFDSSEYLLLSADNPNLEPQMFSKREKDVSYSVQDGGDGFYIRTNYKAKNFRLMKSSYTETNRSSWKEYLPHRQKVYLEDYLMFKDFVAVAARENGLIRLELTDRKTKKTKTISFPDPTYVAEIETNPEFETSTFRYGYTSMVQPSSVYDYKVATGESVLVKQKEVPTYNPDQYKSERVWVKAKDGTAIPVSLVYKKDLFKKDQNPLFIYAYGSYGYSMDASFNSNAVSLLDRGFVYAIAHIRGGQELGRDWYEKGRLMHKKNTFTDFVDVTEGLIKFGYGKPGHVYAEGGSAGGLLMGAVVNLRPDLYHGIHAAVPFVDALTTMLDPSLPLTVSEYEQWGNPNQKPAYDYIKSYSPYDNVKDDKFPNILITTGYHDSQVQYWEPLKWTAKLRDHNKGRSLILMKTEMSAGHSGVTGRFARTREQADDYAFSVWLEENNNTN